jgi:hypothetical protein
MLPDLPENLPVAAAEYAHGRTRTDSSTRMDPRNPCIHACAGAVQILSPRWKNPAVHAADFW